MGNTKKGQSVSSSEPSDVQDPEELKEPLGNEGEQIPPNESGEPQIPPKDPFAGTRWEGKSAEEIARAHQELESKLGEQSKELGQLRGYVAYYQQKEQGQQQAQPRGTEVEGDDDYATMGEIKKMVGEAMKNQEWKMKFENARNQAMYSLDRAKSKEPELFEGVENEVKQLIINGLYYGKIHPDLVVEPENIAQAALMIQRSKGNVKVGKKSITPVEPTHTEAPGHPRKGEEPKPFIPSEKDKIGLKAFGYTEKEAAEVMKKYSKEGE